MEAHKFGVENQQKILLIPGNMMSWRQFEKVIPILAEQCHVIAISTDGYDGSGETTFTTARASAESVEAFLMHEGYDHIDMVFGESFGCATAVSMFHDQKVRIDSMILSGPQYMDFGVFNGLFQKFIPQNQYRLLKTIKSSTKMPWLLKVFTRSNDSNMRKMFDAAAENISLETLRNCTEEAFRLYADMKTFERRENAKVAIWYGAKEPNMKKAVTAIRNVYPTAEDRPFAGLGHGEIISQPHRMAMEIQRFLKNNR